MTPFSYFTTDTPIRYNVRYMVASMTNAYSCVMMCAAACGTYRLALIVLIRLVVDDASCL